MKKLIQQLLRFGVVGVICTVIDYGILIALTEGCGVPPLLSAAISFSVSVIVNYLLSMRFVFERRENANRLREAAAFILLSISGLGLNELLIWLGAVRLGVHYLLAKLFATGVVMVYNFITRKLLLERR